MTQAAPSPSSADTRRRRRVKGLQRPDGGTECLQRRVPAVLTHAAPGHCKALRRVHTAPRPESRRRRVPAVLTHEAPSPNSAESRRHRLVKALQRPGGDAESRQRRGSAVLTQAAPSPRSTEPRRLRQLEVKDAPETRLRRRILVLHPRSPCPGLHLHNRCRLRTCFHRLHLRRPLSQRPLP